VKLMKERILPDSPLKRGGINRWRVYTRGTIHPHRFSIALTGHFKYSAELTGQKLARVFYFCEGSKAPEAKITRRKRGHYSEGPKLWFAWREEDVKSFGNFIYRKLRSPKERNRYFSKMDLCAKNAIKAAENIFKKDLSRCLDDQLLKLYDSVFEAGAMAHGIFNIDIDVFDAVFDNFLRKQVLKELSFSAGSPEFEEIYKELAPPAHKSYILDEEEAAISAALDPERTDAGAEKLFEKYWWINLGWENMKPHNKEYFLKAILKLRKKKGVEVRLKKIKNHIKDLETKRRDLFIKYNFSSNINYWLEFLDKYAHYHDVRKEIQVKSLYALHLIMQEMAKRLKLDAADLEWLWAGELIELFKGGNFDKAEIGKRKRAVWASVSQRGIGFLSGEKAVKKFRDEITVQNEKFGELSGFGASRGIARGRVKVCFGIAEAKKKIRKGDILVCGMTTPDFVPIMRKCAAIVTDEGGLTCHAAIVSRELGIPCIVGTKIATQVLKNGDLVEVDANNGIVKILKS